MSEIGEIMGLGIMSRVYVRAAYAFASANALFFVTVNQVLVRLWTRHQQMPMVGCDRSIRFWPEAMGV